MITKKQRQTLDRQVRNYRTAMRKTHIVAEDTIKWWADRYQIAMEKRLLRPPLI